jgi:hypothetical protein
MNIDICIEEKIPLRRVNQPRSNSVKDENGDLLTDCFRKILFANKTVKYTLEN